MEGSRGHLSDCYVMILSQDISLSRVSVITIRKVKVKGILRVTMLLVQRIVEEDIYVFFKVDIHISLVCVIMYKI